MMNNMHAPIRKLLILFHVLCFTVAQVYTGPEDPRLVAQLELPFVTNGVSTTPSGRLFLVVSGADGNKGPKVVEYDRQTNTSTAYPNGEVWKSYTNGSDPATTLVAINSQRIGPDGMLYLVDTGETTFQGPPLLPYGPKLIQINITTNTVSRVYFLADALHATSFIDDVRFNPAKSKAYITDAGTPSGLIVLDLASGEAVRVLNADTSTQEYMPISAEGRIVYSNGKPVYINADQLEVSPDGVYLYYQPCTGGMSRIATEWLDEAFSNSSFNNNAGVATYVEPWAHTPSTGGTAIDAEGNVYNSDTDSQRIIKITPNGTMTTLVQDPRLLWVDAMWIDSQGLLWMPAAQLNRGIYFGDGKDHITKPMVVYTLDIGIGPSPIDHT